MPQAAKLSVFEVDGVALGVNRIGSGLPVVCLPAIGHDSRDFVALSARCGDRFEFICIDWPGHGSSGPDHAPACARRYADLVGGLLAALGIERPLLIGNSIGGAAGILVAAGHGTRGLVLCDSGGLVRVDATVRAFCGLFEHFFRAGERGASWYPGAFDLYYRMVLPTPAARRRRGEIVAGARRLAPLMRQAWSSFGRPEADLTDLAASLDIPIWIAWAKADRVIPFDRVRPAVMRMKQARVSVFRGGHAPFLEQPDAFADQFIQFAAALAPRGVDAVHARPV
jgi:4,5:9,10-diseco-3-hydroxy-5,9,17-trioxoandrosta-1(10),2-diene-4-oate hydrolase